MSIENRNNEIMNMKKHHFYLLLWCNWHRCQFVSSTTFHTISTNFYHLSTHAATMMSWNFPLQVVNLIVFVDVWSVSQSVSQSVSLSVNLSVCLSVCLSVYLSSVRSTSTSTSTSTSMNILFSYFYRYISCTFWSDICMLSMIKKEYI